MPSPDLTAAVWRKSSLSSGKETCIEVAVLDEAWRKSSLSGEDESCIEVAARADAIAVRDSKDPDGPALVFACSAWSAFAAGSRHGALNRRA